MVVLQPVISTMAETLRADERPATGRIHQSLLRPQACIAGRNQVHARCPNGARPSIGQRRRKQRGGTCLWRRGMVGKVARSRRRASRGLSTIDHGCPKDGGEGGAEVLAAGGGLPTLVRSMVACCNAGSMKQFGNTGHPSLRRARCCWTHIQNQPCVRAA